MTSMEWTWIGGRNGTVTAGVYVDADPANLTPGGRENAAILLDSLRSRILIFGGNAYDEAGDRGTCTYLHSPAYIMQGP